VLALPIAFLVRLGLRDGFQRREIVAFAIAPAFNLSYPFVSLRLSRNGDRRDADHMASHRRTRPRRMMQSILRSDKTSGWPAVPRYPAARHDSGTRRA